MKTFEVEVRRSSYVTVQVQASDLEDAKEIGLEQVEKMFQQDSAEYEVAMAKAINTPELDILMQYAKQIFGKRFDYEPMSELRRMEMDVLEGVAIIENRNIPFEYGYLYTFNEGGETKYRLEWDYYTPNNPELSTTYLSLTCDSLHQFAQVCNLVPSFENFSKTWDKWASQKIQILKGAFYGAGFSMDSE